MSDPLQDPGVQGLAQLGRNAIERVAELEADNAYLRDANRDLKSRFDALKGDYDEAAHFARHFIRDDPEITPRAAIIRLGDKCTSLFARMKIAETERDEWIACHAQLYRKLGSLLAVIHRDGGHYESEHGTEKACADAETAVHVLRGSLDGYVEANRYMKGELDDALEDARKYCDAQREIARLREALQTVVDAADTAPPIKVIAYISRAVEKARAALAQVAEVPK